MADLAVKIQLNWGVTNVSSVNGSIVRLAWRNLARTRAEGTLERSRAVSRVNFSHRSRDKLPR